MHSLLIRKYRQCSTREQSGQISKQKTKMKILMEPCHFEINIIRKHNQMLSKTSKFTDHLKCLCFLLKNGQGLLELLKAWSKTVFYKSKSKKKYEKEKKKILSKEFLNINEHKTHQSSWCLGSGSLWYQH